MLNTISILGSTGSVGTQTIEVAVRLKLRITALAAHSNITLLENQTRRLKPRLVAVFDKSAAKQLKTALSDTDTRVLSGLDGLIEAASDIGSDAVVTALSGAVGLLPTLAAIRAGKRVCLANKETLVCAGDIVMSQARSSGAEIIPVDSEHSAIFQCLRGSNRSELRQILLTASGGPFLGLTREQTANISPAEAIAHPNWSMGAKISIDSATMMNKGLEFIEAMHLFSVGTRQIRILIHPQSIIHSMTEFVDGSIIAQCSPPNMSLPIQYALTYPDRTQSPLPPLDLAALGNLTFANPNLQTFPCLRLALDAAERGGNIPCAMNAADEIAVGRFLRGEIGYNDIYDCIESAMNRIDYIKSPSLDDILQTDAETRNC